MKEISVVIPVYNSEENLIELHKQLTDALRNIEYELIFVNDFSSDHSWKIISQIAANDQHIIAINLRKNFGQDNALMAGFHYVSGKFTVIMDDDLQHSPKDILLMYHKCIEGYDICYARFNELKQQKWKNIGSRLNDLTACWLFKKPKNLYMSPFKIVDTSVIHEIIQYAGPFPYVDGLLLQVTRNTCSVEADHFHRWKGKSNYNFIKSLKVFVKASLSFSVLPLRVATVTGFIISMIGFLFAIYFLIEYFILDADVEGWTSLILSLLVIGGLLLMFMGLIGEYLGRVFLTINRKPQYSIKKILKKE